MRSSKDFDAWVRQQSLMFSNTDLGWLRAAWEASKEKAWNDAADQIQAAGAVASSKSRQLGKILYTLEDDFRERATK